MSYLAVAVIAGLGLLAAGCGKRYEGFPTIDEGEPLEGNSNKTVLFTAGNPDGVNEQGELTQEFDFQRELFPRSEVEYLSSAEIEIKVAPDYLEPRAYTGADGVSNFSPAVRPGLHAVPLFLKPDQGYASEIAEETIEVPQGETENPVDLWVSQVGRHQMEVHFTGLPEAATYTLYNDSEQLAVGNLEAGQREYHVPLANLDHNTLYNLRVEFDTGASSAVVPVRTHWSEYMSQVPYAFYNSAYRDEERDGLYDAEPDVSGVDLEVTPGPSFIQVCHGRVPSAAIYEHSIFEEGEEEPLQQVVTTNNCTTFSRLPKGQSYKVSMQAFPGWRLNPEFYVTPLRDEYGVDLREPANLATFAVTELSLQVDGEDREIPEDCLRSFYPDAETGRGCIINLGTLQESVVISGTLSAVLPSFVGNNNQYDLYNIDGKFGFPVSFNLSGEEHLLLPDPDDTPGGA